MQIDLNADIGEGFDDGAIVPWLSSANISCGAHAGSETEIRQALRLCKKHHVAVGAHPSYPDRQNFGRLALEMPLPELRTSLLQQLDYFLQLATEEGVTVHHLKAHGALYNTAAQHPQIGNLLLQLSRHYQLPLMTLAQSPLHLTAVQQQLPVIAEAFADRGYQANGQLVSRAKPGALLNTDAAISQSLLLVQQHRLQAINGDLLTLQADSLCLHGDSPEAVTLARELHQALVQQNIVIKAKTIHSFSSEAPWTL
ncbi:5-oxoprolinase subunit PxpA [Rheinheimera riviphila]|nr:5-oxoprolinase subunit PxpA [Rheinheimera riviphila]